jgi:hypothetical protein
MTKNITFGLLLVVTAMSVTYALYQRTAANSCRREAEAHAEFAIKMEKRAHECLVLAEEQQRIARASVERAESQLLKAEQELQKLRKK